MQKDFRFSGHESFPLRYAWLPKAYALLKDDADALADDERAMVDLGVGKNMVRAVRFWVQVAGIAEPHTTGLKLTALGKSILGPRGFDPYLEDVRTLWLLHWKIATQKREPLFAWSLLLNAWHFPELTRSQVVDFLLRESEVIGRDVSRITMEQHYAVFLHTYVSLTRMRGEVTEDSLDSPLTELQLIKFSGERRDHEGRLEPSFSFDRGAKPSITDGLFAYLLSDFWESTHRDETTLSLHEILIGKYGPGQLLKLPEWDIRQRLLGLEEASDGRFVYKESSSLQQVMRVARKPQLDLESIYSQKRVHAH